MKDVFSLENGDLTMEYPATFTQADFDDVCSFLAIWMRCRRRSIPKAPDSVAGADTPENVICMTCAKSPTRGWMQITGHDGEPCPSCNFAQPAQTEEPTK